MTLDDRSIRVVFVGLVSGVCLRYTQGTTRDGNRELRSRYDAIDRAIVVITIRLLSWCDYGDDFHRHRPITTTINDSCPEMPPNTMEII